MMILNRNRTCTEIKTSDPKEREKGIFNKYSQNKQIEVVGWIACGSYPGKRLEFPLTYEKIRSRSHLSGLMLPSWIPPDPYSEDHLKFIENNVGLPVVIVTHNMPLNFLDTHKKAGNWKIYEKTSRRLQ